MNLLGWHWLIKLYRFQVYNSIIHLLLYCVFTTTGQFSFHHYLSPLYPLLPPPPASPLVILILLSVSVRVCFLFFLLTCFTFFTQPLQPPTPWRHQSIFIYDSASTLLVYFVHWVPHMSEIIWYLSFSDWFTSFSIIFSRSIYAVAKGKISFFWWPSIRLCKCTTTFLSTHLLTDAWAASKSWLL